MMKQPIFKLIEGKLSSVDIEGVNYKLDDAISYLMQINRDLEKERDAFANLLDIRGYEIRENERQEKLASSVNICGIPHDVIEKEDAFDIDCHFGMIDYKKCEIKINKNMSDASKQETICHEMVHGILVHIGYNELANDEQFVQALGNAIYQGFKIKEL